MKRVGSHSRRKTGDSAVQQTKSIGRGYQDLKHCTERLKSRICIYGVLSLQLSCENYALIYFKSFSDSKPCSRGSHCLLETGSNRAATQEKHNLRGKLFTITVLHVSLCYDFRHPAGTLSSVILSAVVTTILLAGLLITFRLVPRLSHGRNRLLDGLDDLCFFPSSQQQSRLT